MIAPGIRLEMARHTSMVATVPAASSVAFSDQVGAEAARAFIRNQNSLGTLARCRPKKSLICVLAISTAIPLVKPMTTGPRNKFHRGAHASRAQNYQDRARHHGAHVQPVNAVYGDDPRYHDYERAGGPANLSLRSAQCGDQKARHHRAVNARPAV